VISIFKILKNKQIHYFSNFGNLVVLYGYRSVCTVIGLETR